MLYLSTGGLSDHRLNLCNREQNEPSSKQFLFSKWSWCKKSNVRLTLTSERGRDTERRRQTHRETETHTETETQATIEGDTGKRSER